MTEPRKKRREENRGILFYAEKMVRMRARACAISRATGLPPSEVRALWRKITNQSSPSGQQPSDLAWYLRNTRTRTHSALIVQLYQLALKNLPSYAAITVAYYHYCHLSAPSADPMSWIASGDPAFRDSEESYAIPFSRAQYLCQIYTDDEMADGKRKCSLKIRRCKKCGCLYMSDMDEHRDHCTACKK